MQAGNADDENYADNGGGAHRVCGVGAGTRSPNYANGTSTTNPPLAAARSQP